MAKRKTARRRRRAYAKVRSYRRKMTLPVAVLAGFTPTVVGVWNRRTSGTQVASFLQAGYTGIGPDGRFNLANLRVGLMPVVGGFVIHRLAAILGVNRVLSRSGVPLIRI